MELVKGIPLSDYVIKNKKVDEETAKIILFDIICAVQYYQSMGIVHRDLKMENIMLVNSDSKDRRDMQVKVIDFGMSKLK